MKKLDAVEIEKKLSRLKGWSVKGEAIEKEWQFADFPEAMRFINQVAALAEKYDHHPEIWNVYNKVRLTYTTHDAGGLTEKDFKLAEEIDRLSD